jgi:phosphate transport system ATP-binding protein
MTAMNLSVSLPDSTSMRAPAAALPRVTPAETAAARDAVPPQVKIDVRRLSVYYGNFRAISEIDLVIPKGKITSIIGPSGCGKSTLLRAINRMVDLTPGTTVEGQVILDGRNIYAKGVDVVDIRQRVGMVFQRPNPFPKSVYENVAYGPRLYGIHRRAELDDIVEYSLKRAALWDEVKDKLQTSGM